MKSLKLFVAISIATLSSAAFSQQTMTSTFGKGVYIMGEDSSFTMKFNARVQSLLSFEAPAGEFNMDGMTSNWLIRRSRL